MSRAVMLWDLMLIQWSNWRWSWRQQLILGLLVPIIALSILAAVASGSSEEVRRQLLIGGLLTSVVAQNQALVAQNFAFMKDHEADSFFETLGLPRWMLPIGTVSCFALMSAPTVATALLLGPRIVGVAISLSLAVALILLVVASCVGFLGAVIGKLTRTPPESSTTSQLVNFFLIGTGGVLVPQENLPSWSRWLGFVNPVHYAANALRDLTFGPGSLLTGNVVILGIATIVIAAVATVTPWRRQ